MTAATPSFQHLMAANALQVDVPLNFRGEVAVGEGDEVDLKKFGSRIFVDAARIFALATGTKAVNSAERLRQAGPAVGFPAQEIAAVDAAFSQILRLRLRQQINTVGRGESGGYGLKPAALHDVDRAILREALKQAKRLQQRLKLNYAL
jgi:CBS domain-containing protein